MHPVLQQLMIAGLLLFLSVPLQAQIGGFARFDSVSVPLTENTGFGNFISGVDFDGDGKVEIYAVNNNWTDTGNELIPRIYKFEKNGNQWDSVWSATMNVPLQNTWPPLTYGDWDNDGKMEVIWGPVNFTDATSNPNPPRIVVFEYPGDASDNMGVPDGSGGWIANTSWPITTLDNFDLRPFRWFLVDLDNDGAKELVFCSRVAEHRYGVVSLTDVPDGGPGFEAWTLVSSGLDFPPGTIDGGVIYDLAIIDSSFYLFHDNGNVTKVSYSNGTYSVPGIQVNLVPGGSWKSASVVDLDNDGQKEIVIAGWQISGSDQKIYLLEELGDSLRRSTIADVVSLIGSAGRLNGSAHGDVDNDGYLDFIFGGRATTPNAAIIRLRYMGGDIRSPFSYEASLIDQEYGTNPRNWDVINVSNLDTDLADEVLYSGGLDGRIPIVILKNTTTDVTLDLGSRPTSFDLEQNYPNPFNPTTTIRFSLTEPGMTSLIVYDLLGREVAVLLNDNLGTGSYTAAFEAKGFSSGTYIYTLTSNNQRTSKKMVIVR